MNIESIKANGLNINLAIKLAEIIKPDKYRSFTDLLIEIMLRRQVEFNLSDERIIMEAKALVNNLPIISVRPASELSYPAVSSPNGIFFSYEYFFPAIDGDKEMAETLYEVLVHEVYHSIAEHDSGSAFMVEEYDSRGMNELLNEAAANRAAKNYSPSEKKYGIRRTEGYTYLTIFSPVLAAAFGTSEKELLAAGISSKANLEVLNLLLKHTNHESKSFSETKEKAKNLIVSTSKQFEILHNLYFARNPKDKIPKKEMPKYIEAALTAITTNLIQLINFRIENDIRDITPETVSEYAYSYKSVGAMISFILKQYVKWNFISLDQANKIMQNVLPNFKGLQDRILGLQAVSKMEDKSSLSPKTLQVLYGCARGGSLIANTELAKHFGIEIPEDKEDAVKKIDTSSREKYTKDEDWATTYWSNDFSTKSISKAFEFEAKYLLKIDKLFAFKTFFKKLLYRAKSFVSKPRKEEQPTNVNDIDSRSISPFNTANNQIVFINESEYSNIIDSSSKVFLEQLKLVNNPDSCKDNNFKDINQILNQYLDEDEKAPEPTNPNQFNIYPVTDRNNIDDGPDL